MNVPIRSLVAVLVLTTVGFPSDDWALPALATVEAQQPVVSEPPALTERSSRPDSARVHREARIALRAFLWQLEEKAAIFEPMAVEFSCEDSYVPYCFGPGNGGIHPGGLGTRAVEFSYADANIPAMTRARFNRLHRHYFAKLEASHRKLPGDRWIVGQRVFHLVERAQLPEAALVARECRAEHWWCASLVGYVAHVQERYVRADSAFSVALRTMPEAERCRWENLSLLIEGDDAASWYRRLSCVERAAVNDTIWWLADPLFLAPGNERRSAHHLREMYARLSREFAETEMPAWRFRAFRSLPSVGLEPARREPTGEGRVPGSGSSGGPASALFDRPCTRATWRTEDYDPFALIVIRNGVPSHVARNAGECQLLLFLNPMYRFLPTLAAVRDPLHAPADAWSLDAGWSKEYYRPRFGEFTGLDHQLAWFRRGKTARVVAVLDLTRNPVLREAVTSSQTVISGVTLSAGPGDTTRVYRTPIAGRFNVFAVDAPADSVVVSLEGFAPGSGAARARYASGPSPMPPQRIALSDLLLLDGSQGENVSALDTAARHAAANARVARDGTVGLFWEIYGSESDDSVTYKLSSAEGRVASPIGRLGRVLGVIAGDSASVQWTEHRRNAGASIGQSITLSVSGLATGKHLIRLQARVPGQVPVTVSRWIEIVDPGKG